jgi:hypothetical protein
MKSIRPPIVIFPKWMALWGEQFADFSTISFPCVRPQSEPSGPEQARIELQIVILEWLGTAAILAVHLAQVSQVDQAPWACGRFLAEEGQQGGR